MAGWSRSHLERCREGARWACRREVGWAGWRPVASRAGARGLSSAGGAGGLQDKDLRRWQEQHAAAAAEVLVWCR